MGTAPEYGICRWLGLHDEAIRVKDAILAREDTPTPGGAEPAVQREGA